MPFEQKLLRATDKQIVEAFKAISAELDVQAGNLTFLIFADGHPASFTTDLTQLDGNDQIQTLLDRDSVLLRELSILYPQLGNLSIKVQREEPFDLLHVTVRQNQPPPEVQAAAIAAMDRHLQAFKPTPIPEGVLGEDLAAFYRSRDESVLRLERLNTDIITQNEKYRKRLEKDFNDRKKELEDGLSDRRDTLEVEFSTKDEALQAEKQKLDDRSARHARREQF